MLSLMPRILFLCIKSSTIVFRFKELLKFVEVRSLSDVCRMWCVCWNSGVVPVESRRCSGRATRSYGSCGRAIHQSEASIAGAFSSLALHGAAGTTPRIYHFFFIAFSNSSIEIVQTAYFTFLTERKPTKDFTQLFKSF